MNGELGSLTSQFEPLLGPFNDEEREIIATFRDLYQNQSPVLAFDYSRAFRSNNKLSLFLVACGMEINFEQQARILSMAMENFKQTEALASQIRGVKDNLDIDSPEEPEFEV